MRALGELIRDVVLSSMLGAVVVEASKRALLALSARHVVAGLRLNSRYDGPGVEIEANAHTTGLLGAFQMYRVTRAWHEEQLIKTKVAA